MRFGFKVPHHATSWESLIEVWRAGDEIDTFESAWTYDHLVSLQAVDGDIGLDPATPMLDGWSLLGALAARTSRLRLGNLVTCVPLRHPVVLAKMATTVDEISGGRLELGLGAGWMEPESEMYGTDFGSPRERLDRFEEALQVMTGLFETESLDFDGRYYRLVGARIEPKRQKPHPPIWIGGNGEKRTLPIVARWADAWNYTALRPGGELDLFRAKCEILRAHCAEIGRDPKDVVVSVQLSLGDEPAGFAETAAAWGDAGAEYVIVMLPVGATPDVLEKLAVTIEPLCSPHGKSR